MSVADTIGWTATAVFTASYLTNGPARLRRVQMVGASLWLTTFRLLDHWDRLYWSTAMWSGTVVLSGLVGAAMAALVALPAPTGDAVVDSPVGPRPA